MSDQPLIPSIRDLIRSEGPIRDSDRGPRSVRGTYGDGSSSLRLQTFNGNLTVTRR